jgi:hypothetical protein
MENPLQSHYRNKDIYIKLPTGGKFMKNPPELTVDGEIGVRPMTMKDEILMSIPDSLYNGQSLFELIQSICPDIKDPYEISLPDVDVILLASRATSYQKKMPVELKCPKCDELSMYDVNLQMVLGHIKPISDQTEIEVDGLVVEMKPNTLAAVNQNSIKTSETARLLKGIYNTPADEQTQQIKDEYSDAIQSIAQANLLLVVDCIQKVNMPDGQVVENPQHILDWLANSNRKTLDVLQKHQIKMNFNGIPDDYDFTCPGETCGHNFKSGVQFNPSFFFTRESAKQLNQKTSTN